MKRSRNCRCFWPSGVIFMVLLLFCRQIQLMLVEQRGGATVSDITSLVPPSGAATPLQRASEVLESKVDGATSKSGATTGHNSTATSSCPLAIQRARGLYEAGGQDVFQNVVLLTAANGDFSLILDNWRTITDALGLKYAILALDDALYQKMGPDRAVPSDPEQSVQHVGPFRKPKYNRLTCNKLRMIAMVMQQCKVDVVFSDTDNVLLQDPFKRVDFGGMIQSGTYDYMYSTNDAWTAAPNMHACRRSGIMVEEGNTGFHYLSHSSDLLQQMLQASINKCDKAKNRLDDQTNFWKVMRRFHNSADQAWRHCQYDGAGYSRSSSPRKPNASSSEGLSLCCLDPHYYSTGSARPAPNHSLVTFHANFNQGIEDKILKLKEWVDGGWTLTS